MTLDARNERTRFTKRKSTLYPVFAEVSRNSHPNSRAREAPSSLETSRADVWSHLLPTSTNTGLLCLTRFMDCQKLSTRSNVVREVTEYIRIKPWPSLSGIQHMAQACRDSTHRIHWSRRVVYSSERKEQWIYHRSQGQHTLTLPGSVNDLYKAHMTVYNKLFTIRILYSGIVRLWDGDQCPMQDEVAVGSQLTSVGSKNTPHGTWRERKNEKRTMGVVRAC